MSEPYCVQTCRLLAEKALAANLHRPPRIDRYEPGDRLSLVLTPILPQPACRADFLIEQFVGGGFAGQVYQVRLAAIEPIGSGVVSELEPGQTYALKILVPPTSFARVFRNFLYAVGFQGPFQLQVNPAAARAGAIWQKFIRIAAAGKFADPNAVNDVYATFIDHNFGSCGEVSCWVQGRTWRLEVDDYMDLLKVWKKGKNPWPEKLGSPEYRAKFRFMKDLVELLGEMGAPELARQYEWSTCKSQPNCLKRLDAGPDPAAGLTAVDFRAGLALLPVLPMSPGDFALIAKGVARGSLVQFDRGDIPALQRFIENHRHWFQTTPGLDKMLEELKDCEKIYRDSLPDITHNHIRLLYDGRLWNTLTQSAVTGWKVRGLIDDASEKNLRQSKTKIILFALLGLLPFIGNIFRKSIGRPDWRAHYRALFTSAGYFLRAFNARIAQTCAKWHRAGRISSQRAISLAENPLFFLGNLPFSILPAGLHRFFTDPKVFIQSLYYLFVRPVKLYFNADMRRQWLTDMLGQGRKKHLLSDDDAAAIGKQLDEPFIQKYLVSLVVHALTLPVTQIVSVSVAVWYKMAHGLTWYQAKEEMLLILAIFQVTPISPGSICRGLYTTYMAIKDRDFKNYNIALFLSYFKYVGYLAFPIQMTYRYPALARFMAAHWATEAVHIVPVFGERGALLEHSVFCAFYNWPLTIRRRMKNIAAVRKAQRPRLFHAPIIAAFTAAILLASHIAYHNITAFLPSGHNFWFLKPLWFICLPAVILAGASISALAGGASIVRRIALAASAGAATAILYSVAAYFVEAAWQAQHTPAFWLPIAFKTFAFTFLSVAGCLLAELFAPDPELKKTLKSQTKES